MNRDRARETILVVDDDRSVCEMIASSLELEGYTVDRASSSGEALALVSSSSYRLVVSDIYIDELTGLDLLRSLARSQPDARLILVTAHATLETAVAAVREGAFDYLAKPFELDDLVRLVRRALEPRERGAPAASDAGETASLASMIVGRSPAMAEVYRRIARVAATDSSIWISGESGTGKELVARAIHRHSRRANRPFVAVNCGALAETLLESELFGHVKGAFTGAAADRGGLFESAAGGTLFLDEITETSLAFQVKLLRLLQEGEYRPVGASVARRADVRVVAASNLDASAAMREGRFREDLYYRLAAFAIELPPLRERAGDFALLVRHFLVEIERSLSRPLAVSPAGLELLASYDWPGNIRQLRNSLERLAILSPDGHIRDEDVRRWLEEIEERPAAQAKPPVLQSLTQMEKERIRTVLAECGGNKRRAAEILGIDRSTLYRKIEAYGLSLPDNASTVGGTR